MPSNVTLKSASSAALSEEKSHVSSKNKTKSEVSKVTCSAKVRDERYEHRSPPGHSKESKPIEPVPRDSPQGYRFWRVRVQVERVTRIHRRGTRFVWVPDPLLCYKVVVLIHIHEMVVLVASIRLLPLTGRLCYHTSCIMRHASWFWVGTGRLVNAEWSAHCRDTRKRRQAIRRTILSIRGRAKTEGTV